MAQYPVNEFSEYGDGRDITEPPFVQLEERRPRPIATVFPTVTQDEFTSFVKHVLNRVEALENRQENPEWFSGVDQTLDSHDKQINALNGKFKSVSAHVSENWNLLEAKLRHDIASLSGALYGDNDTEPVTAHLSKRVKQFQQVIPLIAGRVSRLEEKFGNIDILADGVVENLVDHVNREIGVAEDAPLHSRVQFLEQNMENENAFTARLSERLAELGRKHDNALLGVCECLSKLERDGAIAQNSNASRLAASEFPPAEVSRDSVRAIMDREHERTKAMMRDQLRWIIGIIPDPTAEVSSFTTANEGVTAKIQSESDDWQFITSVNSAEFAKKLAAASDEKKTTNDGTLVADVEYNVREKGKPEPITAKELAGYLYDVLIFSKHSLIEIHEALKTVAAAINKRFGAK